MVSKGVYIDSEFGVTPCSTAAPSLSLHTTTGKEFNRRFVWDKKLTRVDYV